MDKLKDNSRSFKYIFVVCLLLVLLPERLYLLFSGFNSVRIAIYALTYCVFLVFVIYFVSSFSRTRTLYQVYKDMEGVDGITSNFNKGLFLAIALFFLIVIIPAFLRMTPFHTEVFNERVLLDILVWRIILLGIFESFLSRYLSGYTLLGKDFLLYKADKIALEDIEDFEIGESSLLKKEQLILHLENGREVKLQNNFVVDFNLKKISQRLAD